jgi:predicted DNA-binding protein
MNREKGITIRMSDRMLNRLRAYAEDREKSMSQVLKDYISTLPDPQP